MKISVAQNFKSCYDILWWKAPNAITSKDGIDIVSRGYDVIDHLFTNNLLFVGINPGYDQTSKSHNTPPPSQFGFVSSLPFDYKYFKPFEKVSLECGYRGEYSYLDILVIRETSQSKIQAEIKNNKAFLKFCQDQFLIFKKMLCMARPEVIVVCNAYAGTWMGNPANTFTPQTLKLNPYAFNYRFDDSIGTYRIKDTSCLDTVPVFFSGMFSGRHTVDKGSLERLEWQIRTAKFNNLLNI